jgi:hypothetical protein
MVRAFENMYPLYQLFEVIDFPTTASSAPITIA